MFGTILPQIKLRYLYSSSIKSSCCIAFRSSALYARSVHMQETWWYWCHFSFLTCFIQPLWWIRGTAKRNLKCSKCRRYVLHAASITELHLILRLMKALSLSPALSPDISPIFSAKHSIFVSCRATLISILLSNLTNNCFQAFITRRGHIIT